MGDYLEKVAKWLKRIVVCAVALFVVVGLGISIKDKISDRIEDKRIANAEIEATEDNFIACIEELDNDIKENCYVDGILDKDKFLETNVRTETFSHIGSHKFEYVYKFINYAIFYDYIDKDLSSDFWIDSFCNEEYCDITRAIIFNNYLCTYEDFDTIIADFDGIKMIYEILEDEDTGFWLKQRIVEYLYGWLVIDIEFLHIDSKGYKMARKRLDKARIEGYLLELLDEASDYDEMQACLYDFYHVYDEDVVKIFSPYIENPQNYEGYKVHSVIEQLEVVYSNKKEEVSDELKQLYDKALEYISEELEDMALNEDSYVVYATYISMLHKSKSWENVKFIFDKAFELDKTSRVSIELFATYREVIYQQKEEIVDKIRDKENINIEDFNEIVRFMNLTFDYKFIDSGSYDDIKLYIIRAISDYENNDALEKLKYVTRELNYDNGYIIAKGDFDGDGADDVSKVHMYVLDGVGNRLELRLGNGDNLDYDFKQEEIGHGYEYSLVFKDLNNDGQAEIVLCSSFKTKGELVNCIMVFEKNGNEYSLISSESLTDWKEQVILDMDEISPFLIDGKTEWEMQEEL